MYLEDVVRVLDDVLNPLGSSCPKSFSPPCRERSGQLERSLRDWIELALQENDSFPLRC